GVNIYAILANCAINYIDDLGLQGGAPVPGGGNASTPSVPGSYSPGNTGNGVARVGKQGASAYSKYSENLEIDRGKKACGNPTKGGCFCCYVWYYVIPQLDSPPAVRPGGGLLYPVKCSDLDQDR